MILFPRPGVARPELVLTSASLILRPPQMADFEEWSDIRRNSRAFLQPWEPTWHEDDLTRAGFKRRLKRYAREIHADEAFPFFLYSASHGHLMGGVNLTNIRRGAAAMASLGYWMGEAHASKGHMTLAVRMVAEFVFQHLKLRRLEAACLPGNLASIHLLEKVGFTKEGYARDYLLINGEWQDHLLYALLQQDFR